MKAVRLLEYGGKLVFNDVATPTIARDEILIKIKSTAVNHLDSGSSYLQCMASKASAGRVNTPALRHTEMGTYERKYWSREVRIPPFGSGEGTSPRLARAWPADSQSQ